MDKDIVRIISLNGDSIKVELKLTETIAKLLDLLVQQYFIKDWCISKPEVIYKI